MPIVHAGGVAFDVDAIAFDKDGTLIDLDATWGPVATAWVHGVALGDAALAVAIAVRLGLDLPGRTLVPDSIFSAGTLEQIRSETEAILATNGRDRAAVDHAVLAGAEAVVALGAVEPAPLADLPALFARLRDGGVRCGVVTADDRASASTLLASLGVAELVDVIVGGDETERPKPAPDALHLAARRFDVTPDRILMVGDSLTDQGAARGAGSPFVAVGHDTAAAQDCDAVVAHVGELTVA